MKTSHSNKTKIIVALEILLAGIFVLGSRIYHEAFRLFYFSYVADIVIPFGFYFLLTINEHKYPKLNNWAVKALLIFALCATSEILQYFGIYALARVFDPIDFLMYGLGVLLAALVDKQIFKRVFRMWW